MINLKCGNTVISDIIYEYFDIWAMDIYDIEHLLHINDNYIFSDADKIIKVTNCGKNEWATAFKKTRLDAYNIIKDKTYSFDFYDVFVSDSYVLQYMEKIEVNKNLQYSEDGIIKGFSNYIREFYTTDLVYRTLEIMESMWDLGVVHTDIFKNVGSREKKLVIYDYDSLMTREDYQYDPSYKKTFKQYVYDQFITKYKNESHIPLAKRVLDSWSWK